MIFRDKSDGEGDRGRLSECVCSEHMAKDGTNG